MTMKKFYIFLIFLCVSIAMQADDNIAQTIQSLSQYNQISSTDSDKLSMLKKLGGDTISFEFPFSRWQKLIFASYMIDF